LTREDAGAGRSADRLVAERGSEHHAATGHLVEIGRQVHRVETHRADTIPSELVENYKDDVRLRGGGRGLLLSGCHRGRRGRQQVAASRMDGIAPRISQLAGTLRRGFHRRQTVI
jgi:hypothetical protein